MSLRHLLLVCIVMHFGFNIDLPLWLWLLGPGISLLSVTVDFISYKLQKRAVERSRSDLARWLAQSVMPQRPPEARQ